MDLELLQADDALFVAGIGWIAQHDCWLDMIALKGVDRFARDIRSEILTKK
tara:strand:- start:227 stop:379 length:153 start_codon:yes stop_codon:yes gene_type:complete